MLWCVPGLPSFRLPNDGRGFRLGNWSGLKLGTGTPTLKLLGQEPDLIRWELWESQWAPASNETGGVWGQRPTWRLPWVSW